VKEKVVTSSTTGWSKPTGRKMLFPVTLLVLCLLLTIAVWKYTDNDANSHAQDRFDFRATEISNSLADRVAAYELALRGGLALFAAVGDVTRSQWHDYVSTLNLNRDYPGIQGLGYSPWVPAIGKELHIENIRQKGFPEYTIRPPGDRFFYTPVIFLEPDNELNKRAFGYDTFSEPIRCAAIERARDTGNASITGKIKLVQEANKDVQAGFIMFLPFYAPGAPGLTVEERRSAVLGFVNAPFRMNDFMQGLVGKGIDDLGVEIFDGADMNDRTLMFRSKALAFARDSEWEPLATSVRSIDILGYPWTVRFTSLPAFEATMDHRVPRLILAVGAFLSLIMFFLAEAMMNTQTRAESLANKMTTSLRESEERVGSILARLGLATQAAGIGIWEYDAVNNALVWDENMYKLYGIEPRQFSGAYEAWEAGLHPDDLADGRAAINKALKGIEDFQPEFRVIWPSDNSIHYIKANALVERDASGNPLRMIGTNWDISANKKAEHCLLDAYAEVEQRVAHRTQELAEANELLHAEIIDRKLAHREINQILSSISAILIGVDRDGVVVRWNGASVNAFAIQAQDVIGKALYTLHIPWDWEKVVNGIYQTRSDLEHTKLYNIWYERVDGQDGFFIVTVSPLWDDDREYDGFLILGDDISEVKFLEAQLAQAGKLEAIGQLAAGIAHEINTPIQYVGDSLTFLNDAFNDLSKAVLTLDEFIQDQSNSREELMISAKNIFDEMDVEFIRGEAPKSFERIFGGMERISTIIQAMKRFSYSSGDEKKSVNITEAINNTLVISRNEWKYVADVVTDFDPNLTDILCMPGEINQVLLNIIVNASHAIGDVVRGTSGKGLITIITRKNGDMGEISIKDTGSGIAEDVRDKVFNLFFTTKDVDKGSGQGLAISYDIVVNKHGGTITFESEVGRGTAFLIRLPLGV